MTGNERENAPSPFFPVLPASHLSPAASATRPPRHCHPPPQAEQAPGTSLAPKTQLRDEEKERPVWRVALAPNPDAGASEWQGRQGSADPRAAEVPPHLAPPAQLQASGNFLLKLERVLPLRLSCGLLGLSPPPRISAPYQIAWASFINAWLLVGGGEHPLGICSGTATPGVWALWKRSPESGGPQRGRGLRTKLDKSAAAAPVSASRLTKWKRSRGWRENQPGRELPLPTLCIFNINVIKAVSPAGMQGKGRQKEPGHREAGVCVEWGQLKGKQVSCSTKVG